MVGSQSAFGRRKWTGPCPGKGNHPKSHVVEVPVMIDPFIPVHWPNLVFKTVVHPGGGGSSCYIYEGKSMRAYRFYCSIFGDRFHRPYGCNIRLAAGNAIKHDAHGNEVYYDPAGLLTPDAIGTI